MHDSLGCRMKEHENHFNQRVKPQTPVIARIDGKAFHSFTAGMKRPYDERLSNLMWGTLEFLMKQSGAIFGYTQSDEISLLYYQESLKSQIYFDGKINKLNSVLASYATSYFNRIMKTALSEPKYKYIDANFDCRTFELPSKEETLNYFIWREQDAVRNSIQMAARSVFSHSECNDKNGSELQEMLFSKGINWSNYPTFFKRGLYAKLMTTKRKFTTEELADLPEKHEARANPDLIVERRDVKLEGWSNGLGMGDKGFSKPGGWLLNREDCIKFIFE